MQVQEDHWHEGVRQCFPLQKTGGGDALPQSRGELVPVWQLLCCLFYTRQSEWQFGGYLSSERVSKERAKEVR